MGQRIVYFGPINNDFKKDLLDKSVEYLKKNEGNKFYYILPTGNLLTKYRHMLLKDLKGVLDINVITFDDITEMLLSKELYIHIDDAAKETIISRIVRELSNKGEIAYYNGLVNSEGFIGSVSYIIGELKRSLVLPDHFSSRAPKTPRFLEIGEIYKEYQSFLDSKGLVDKEEYFIKSLERLNQDVNFFNDLDFVVIDEFFDFRPQELEILKSMCKYNFDIYVNIPYKTKKDWTTVEKTLDALKTMGFTIQEVGGSSRRNDFEKIGDSIFIETAPIYEKTDKLKLIKAPNKYLEVKKICEEIKRLSDEINLEDIGIVVGNLDSYKEVLIKTFKEERVPSTLMEEIKLIDVPLIREIANLLELKLSNYDKESMTKVLKSGYLDICDGMDRDKIEYTFHILKIKDTKAEYEEIINKERKRLNYLIKNDDEKRDIYNERLEDIANLHFIINTLIEKTSDIPDRESAENITKKINTLLGYYNIENGIKSVYKGTKDYSMLQRDVSALSRFKQILKKVESIAGIVYDGSITLKDYYDILIRLLNDETFVVNHGNSRGVGILTPSTARGLRFKTLFIIGLSQGEYPNISDNNWFFRDEDYQVFKDMGLDIKTYKEKLDKESLLFTVAITRGTDKLVLSYPESTNGQDVSIPSMFLDEMLNLFKGEDIKDKIDYISLSIDYLFKEKFEEITHEREFLRYLLHRHYLGEEVKGYLKIVDDKIGLTGIIDRIDCEIKRYEGEFNEYDGLIGDEKIRQDIADYLGNSKFSISQLETYGKCPFRFLYEKFLKIEGIEREIEEFSAIDRGNIYHEILAIYYKNHINDFREDLLNGKDFDVEATRDEIAYIAEQVIGNYGIQKINKIWELRIETIVNRIINLVKEDLKRLRKFKLKFLPHEFEVKFGYDRDFIVKIGEMEVKLLGKIDRIDVSEDKSSYIVYDYKYSKFGINTVNSMIDGLSLQLPVYIMSQLDNDREVIGGGYIVIKSNEMPIKVVKEEMKSSLNKRSGKDVLNEDEWNNLLNTVKTKIGEYVKKIFDGDFRLNPLECDNYCTLKDICRYDKERIERKGDSCGIN
jgi:ATP-dependent helicase/DNAse subunit B